MRFFPISNWFESVPDRVLLGRYSSADCGLMYSVMLVLLAPIVESFGLIVESG